MPSGHYNVYDKLPHSLSVTRISVSGLFIYHYNHLLWRKLGWRSYMITKNIICIVVLPQYWSILKG